jgi:hypothetical protein
MTSPLSLLKPLINSPRGAGNAGLATDSGVFMKELQAELHRRNLKVTFKGIRNRDPDLLAQDLNWFRQLTVRTQGQEPHQ